MVYHPTSCVHHLFEQQAAQTPHAIAAVCHEQHLTYQALNAQANQLAHHLQTLGVNADTLVGLYVERSLEMLIGMLGILKAGGAYLPLDPHYPAERLAFMLADAAPAIVLTQQAVQTCLPTTNALCICLDNDKATFTDLPTENLVGNVNADNLAYVIYTSGSTGKPKGVLVEHRGLCNVVAAQRQTFALQPQDRVLQFASLNFDAATFEIWLALGTGASLYLGSRATLTPGEPLWRFLSEQQISMVTLTPSTLAALPAVALPHLHTIAVAGEACPANLVQQWGQERRFFNLYGPTEASIWCTTMRCQALGQTPPIGQAIANTRVYLLDADLQAVSDQQIGEIYIGGVGVARGYLHRPDLTAERFIPNPFGEGHLYRTGDLARTLADGNLEFLGRADQQVKIRGFRIELGEIEAVLGQHPLIREAVAVVLPASRGDPQLVAYVTLQTADVQDIASALHTSLQNQLPDYMIPNRFVLLDTMPLTPNGKIDRQALPDPALMNQVGTYHPPQTPLEQLLVTIWEDVLDIKPIGRCDHFFANGGHSLLATQVIARLQRSLNVEISVGTLFEFPILADLACALAQSSPSLPAQRLPPLVAQERPATIPLSYAQQRLWFLHQLEKHSTTYHITYPLQLEGELNVAHLQQAWRQLVQRHESLRTVFPAVDGVPQQVILPELPLPLVLVDRQGQTPADLQAHWQATAAEPFALSHAPLLRINLYCVAANRHVLLLVCHHIIADGWSMGVLLRELEQVYSALQTGVAPVLAPLSIQYADFTLWQRAGLQGDTLNRQLAYWQRQLAEAPTLSAFPTDFPRPARQRFQGGSLAQVLDTELTHTLQQFNQQHSVSLFMTLYSVLAVLLARYSGQEDIVLGSTIANRQQQASEGLVGFFVNTLPLRARLEGNPRFLSLLQQVRQLTLAAYAHQDVPFEQLVSALKLERNLSHTPLFQVMLTLDNTRLTPSHLADLRVTPLELESTVAKFDLTLHLREQDGQVFMQWEYDRDLFTPATIGRLAGHFQHLLHHALTQAQTPVFNLPLLSDAERQQLLVDWNDTQRPYPRTTLIHSLFSAQAQQSPDAIALVFGATQLSYQDLEARANRMAHYLIEQGVQPGHRVGLCVKRSLEMPVAILAILKAGAAYVPLDPHYPRERLAFMLEDTAATLILTQTDCDPLLPLTTNSVNLDTCAEWLHAYPDYPPNQSGEAESLAYVMYTSGSTGQPKGVCVTHRNVLRLVCNNTFADLDAQQTWLQLAPIAFDAATLEIWGALLHGGRLVIMPPQTPSLLEIASAIRTHGITSLWLTAGLFHALVDECLDSLRPLRQLLAGGDVLSVSHVQTLRQALPDCRLINGYGPTENTTFTCCYTVPAHFTGNSVPIGKPIANTSVYLLDKQMQPVPIGVMGELYAGGDGVAAGYLHRPDLTTERFIPNPFGTGQLYRTGDLARWLPDGNLEFLGRADQQVKIRGFRIEPGEVEAVLGQHPLVREVAVKVLPDARGDKQLVAYLVMPPTPPEEATTFLRPFLQSKLPDYLIPSSFVTLDAMPLTPNGKLNRQALPDPTVLERQEDYAPAQTPLEQLLVDIWEAVLGIQPIGRHDHFFAKGGHSLLATQIVARLQRQLHVDIEVSTLFEFPVLAELATALEQQITTDSPAATRLPALKQQVRPAILPLSYAQQRLWFLEQLEGNSATYNIPYALQLDGELAIDCLQHALQLLVQRHESLRTVFTAVDGVPQQHILPMLTLPLDVLDRQGYSPAAIEAHWQQLAAQPFDLTQAPLLRTTLYRMAANRHVLLLVCHHIIADGWSLGVLLRELNTLYGALRQGIAPTLPALPLQYADFTLWQRAWLQGEALEHQQQYWQQHLAGAPALLNLPTDFPRPVQQTFNGACVISKLDQNLTQTLHQFNQQHAVSLFMTLYAVLAVLLARYSGQEDVVIGTTIANRQQQASEGLIGFFANTLPLRIRLEGNPSFQHLLQQVRQLTLAAYAYQDVPFEQLVAALNVERNLSHAPLFQVMLTLDNTQGLPTHWADVQLTPLELANRVAKFDLTLHLHEQNGVIVMLWEYNRDLFAHSSIERLSGHFQHLLSAALAQTTTPVLNLPFLDETERQQLLVGWNATQHTYPRDISIQQMVSAQAARQPQAIAVKFGQTQLCYQALEEQSNQLAHYLVKQGVQRGDRVGLCVERSLAMPVAILAILKAGAAYVPLDPHYPLERLQFLLEDSQLGLIVTQQTLLEQLPPTLLPLVCVDSDWSRITQQTNTPLNLPHSPDDPAYMIYTSGSTGRPKGVLVRQRNLVHSTHARLHYYADNPLQRFLLLSSLAFDSSVAGIFWSLCSGGTLVLPPPGAEKEADTLADLIAHDRITHILLLPSLYHLLLNQTAAQLTSLQAVIVAGESCPPALPPLHQQHLPHTSLYNEYGPTEGTVWSTVYRFPPHWQGTQAPIGQAISNVQLYVLDTERQPVPIGVSGELYIGGEGITVGYWQRPKLTAEKFIPNPFGSGKLYRSGDQVRWQADGNLLFVGRMDQQVKIRGFRIEPGEIEAVLSTHPQLQEAVVLPYPDSQGHWQLAAYVVAHAQTAPSTPALLKELRQWLANRLPAYMQPAGITCLPTMPLTPNGKLDRKALPAPEQHAAMTGNYLPPLTPVEIALAAIWETLLKVQPIGRNADFFALGGHSLLLVQLAAHIRQTFHITVSLRVLFQHSTLSQMAAIIEATPVETPATHPEPAIRSNPPPALPEIPYVQFIGQDLSDLIRRSELPPIQSAALTYWPDEVLNRYDLSRESLLQQTFRGKPTVAAIMVTPWGRIVIILLPRLLSELYVDPSLPDAIADALRLAHDLGAGCVSLTGLLPSATRYGHSIPPALSASANWPSITTGHAMTAAAVVHNIDHIVKIAGRNLARETVACLGLGSIGLTSLRLLLQVLPHPRRLLLCDLYSKHVELERLVVELVEVCHFRGVIEIVTVEAELPATVYAATLIIGATNVPDVLDVARLQPGTLIVDDSGPHCFNPQQALQRLKQSADILFTEGGALYLPQGLQHQCYTPAGLENVFIDSGMLDPHILMGCTLSSLLSALHAHLPATLGMPDTAECLAFYQALQQLGVAAAPLQCDDYLLSDAAIEHFRQHFAHDTLAC